MCLRYAFTTTKYKMLMERFGLSSMDETITPRYNIAPTQNVPVIFNDSDSTLSSAKWGLPANWHDKSGGSHLLFNARAETVDKKPVFRKDFEERRCLMLADSFYEWKKPEKRPFRVYLEDTEPFAFAGIYAVQEQRSCCMITVPSNELVSKIHNRMPVILPKGKEKEWLRMDAEEAKAMLAPYQSRMGLYELSKKINSSKTDSPDLIKPKTDEGTLLEYMK